jgi:transposase InsO family protein
MADEKKRSERTPSGQHGFGALCAAVGIAPRLTRVRRPQTSGMVERFNWRIEDVLGNHHFTSGEGLRQTSLRSAWLYNHPPPQAARNARTPAQALEDWHRSHPHLFDKRP